jgi:hypothetical protein
MAFEVFQLLKKIIFIISVVRSCAVVQGLKEVNNERERERFERVNHGNFRYVSLRAYLCGGATTTTTESVEFLHLISSELAVIPLASQSVYFSKTFFFFHYFQLFYGRDERIGTRSSLRLERNLYRMTVLWLLPIFQTHHHRNHFPVSPCHKIINFHHLLLLFFVLLLRSEVIKIILVSCQERRHTQTFGVKRDIKPCL